MHSIRLRGPWECHLPGSAEPRPVTMPASWDELAALASSGAPLPWPVTLVRRFGCPTGIGPRDELRLVVDSALPELAVSLNGCPLEESDLRSYRISGLLQHRNDLAIRLTIPPLKSLPSGDAAPINDVRLEIESAS